MYLFKSEKKNELLNGKTTRWLANSIGVTESYLSLVLNGKRTCSVVLASLILIKLQPDSDIEEYFIKEEK